LFVVGLDGSNAKLILAAEAPVGSKEIHHLDVQLSPDGLGLAYVRQEDLPNGDVAADELWSVDLATGDEDRSGACALIGPRIRVERPLDDRRAVGG
jgi:hypothetical protein